MGALCLKRPKLIRFHSLFGQVLRQNTPGKKLMKICCFLNVIAKKLIVVTLSVTAFMDDAYVLILFYEDN